MWQSGRIHCEYRKHETYICLDAFKSLLALWIVFMWMNQDTLPTQINTRLHFSIHRAHVLIIEIGLELLLVQHTKKSWKFLFVTIYFVIWFWHAVVGTAAVVTFSFFCSFQFFFSFCHFQMYPISHFDGNNERWLFVFVEGNRGLSTIYTNTYLIHSFLSCGINAFGKLVSFKVISKMNDFTLVKSNHLRITTF